MNLNRKNWFLWLVAAWVVVSMGNMVLRESQQPLSETVEYSRFVEQVRSGAIEKVAISLDKVVINGVRHDGTRFVTHNPGDPKLIDDLLEKKVVIIQEPPRGPSLGGIFLALLPYIFIILVFWYFSRQMQGGSKGAMGFGRSRAKLQTEGQVRTTFADVAGCAEAKEEVTELVDFLRDPERFQKLGGAIPRGVLMVGPPGTGKTLLAKAIAGEAKVPFFSISGSDFVEMFVGVGASRVRDMFEQARRHAPCIIFIDEIDAVGRHRGAGMGGGHDEREQTLNQMLVEMDGFEGKAGIIVIAATNRPDVLDPALLRPGRFDRQVVVGLPDVKGREEILSVHLRKVPAAADVVPSIVARGTPGFSGADLANLVNEAALMAARKQAPMVTQAHLDAARDKILMGTEKRSIFMNEKERRLTAYHEAGHAIIGRLMPDHDPVYKVSIIPRGRALGVTMYLPEEDRYSMDKTAIESRLCALYGGRAAEELVFGADKVTTGASNDIQRATELVRNMVTKWGLSRLGPQSFNDAEEEVFLGRSMAMQQRGVSERTARKIDEEVHITIDTLYARTLDLLRGKMDVLHAMSAALLVHETLDAEQIDILMSGGTLAAPQSPAAPQNAGSPEGPSGPAMVVPLGVTPEQLKLFPVT